MIKPKSPDQIEKMRKGGKIAARILNLLKDSVKPGITTQDLDIIAQKEIKKTGVTASFLNFHGYPASICASVNSEVVHGIPAGRILREGDIVGIDLGILYDGYHTDIAITVPVGKIDYEKNELIKITKQSLDEGLSIIRPGIKLGDIQNRIQKIAEGAGYSVIRDLSGHGIGENLQEYPSIPNFGEANAGPVLEEGYTLAIEPMVAMGDWHVKVLKDGWTVETEDGLPAAHFEHTIAVTRDGYEILTKE